LRNLSRPTLRSRSCRALRHGRGSNEQDVIGLAAHLPVGPAYVAVRAPIAKGSGFAYRGIGRPVAASLRVTMDWFEQWLEFEVPAGRPVLVTAQCLSMPAFRSRRGRLVGLPVFVRQG
jgi:hypothetical protein